MDNISLCSSLVKWLQAFPGLSTATTQSLSDGVQLSEALHEIEPEFFSSVWMSKIKTDVGDNWRLKVSNLHKIHESVVEFYTDQVGPTIQHFKAPDLKKIGELSDETELGQLLQLILGCAINCKQKQKHIETIMCMEESVQTLIVNGIQDLMNKEGSPPAPGLYLDGPPSYHPQIKSLMEQLESTSLAKEEMDRRCNELDHQISMLVDERNNLKTENDKLNERVDILEKGGDFGSSRYIDLRKQVDGLQEELYKTESARDEYRLRVDDLDKIVTEVSSKNEELVFLADEARALKDEVDTLRGVSEKVAEYETTIETFKRRQEEFSDLRRQVKILEEKNSNYMQNNLELEEEVTKSSALRPQVDMLRKQITDLHQKLADETKQKDKLVFDAKKLGDKLEAVTQEKDRIMVERFHLQKSIEELRCSVSADSASKSPSDLEDIDALEIVSPQIREKLIRLQYENRLLKRKANEKGGESSPVFESMFNDLQERFDRLQLENRQMNQKIMELESELEDNKQSTIKFETVADGSSNINNLESKLSEQSIRISSLEDNLAKKENDMCAMEERYKRYLNKAKAVIRTLDPKNNPILVPDMSELRAQLTEKDKMINNLEKDSEKAKHAREREEKLLTSAVYNFGLHLHRNIMSQRLASLDQSGQPFLARQRQSASRRQMGGVGNNRSPSNTFIDDMKY